MKPTCAICQKPIDPTAPTTAQRIQGWERRAIGQHRRGGSDIIMRERLDEVAHLRCVELARAGIAPAQEALKL